MPIKDYKIEYKHVIRPWGNEVRVAAVGEKTIQQTLFFGKAKPDETEIMKRVSALIDKMETYVQVEIPEMPISKTEVEEYLKAEGILLNSESIEDLKAKVAVK